MKDLNFYFLITNLAVAVLCGALLPILPALTRKSFLFGVKIPLEMHASPEAKALRRRYVAVSLAGTAAILALIILQYILFPELSLISILYFPLLFVAVQMAAFIPNWKRALKLKKERGWQVSNSVFAETKSSHTRGNLSELPWLWYILSLVLIVAGLVAALIQYPGLPARIPTHFDIDMQPDAWADKSLLAVMTMPLINAATLLLMWLTGVMFVRAKLQIDPQKPALSFLQHRLYRRRMGNSLGFLTLALTIMMVWIGLMSLQPKLMIPFWVLMALIFVPIVILIAVVVRSGQGGCRIKPKDFTDDSASNPNDQAVSDGAFERGDDKYWALGMFYHNPDDPASVVEDRFGSNLGFNYARLPVKIGVIASLLVLVAVYVWVTILLCSL